MENTSELKEEGNNMEGNSKKEIVAKSPINLFLEKCILQKRFFSGQATFEEYKNMEENFENE